MQAVGIGLGAFFPPDGKTVQPPLPRDAQEESIGKNEDEGAMNTKPKRITCKSPDGSLTATVEKKLLHFEDTEGNQLMSFVLVGEEFGVINSIRFATKVYELRIITQGGKFFSLDLGTQELREDFKLIVIEEDPDPVPKEVPEANGGWVDYVKGKIEERLKPLVNIFAVMKAEYAKGEAKGKQTLQQFQDRVKNVLKDAYSDRLEPVVRHTYESAFALSRKADELSHDCHEAAIVTKDPFDMASQLCGYFGFRIGHTLMQTLLPKADKP